MKVIVVSHGGFAKGAIEALEMITGQHDIVDYITMGEDINSFESQLNELSLNSECIYLADLVGGHPFNTAVKSMLVNREVDQFVIGGFNLGILIEVTMMAESTDCKQIYNSISNISGNAVKVIANWEM